MSVEELVKRLRKRAERYLDEALALGVDNHDKAMALLRRATMLYTTASYHEGTL